MITPHKYLDLNISLLNLGGMILNIIKDKGSVKYDDLLNKIILASGSNAKDIFIPALSFLYILGKIEYQKEIDTIIFIK